VLLKEDLVGKTPFYSGIDEARFKRQVRPGDTIEVTAKITYRRATTYIVEAKCSVEGQLCAKGKLMFTLVPKKEE
jgi:3-hydroxyacyl-[acyl-carrier-protein] dehydratase